MTPARKPLVSLLEGGPKVTHWSMFKGRLLGEERVLSVGLASYLGSHSVTCACLVVVARVGSFVAVVEG